MLRQRRKHNRRPAKQKAGLPPAFLYPDRTILDLQRTLFRKRLDRFAHAIRRCRQRTQFRPI